MLSPVCISVITPSYNREKFIARAVQSVLDQDFSCVEHIVLDGKSTDDTLMVLEKFSQIKVISEPDNGMYDALNQGLRIITGNVICFLNSDDYLIKNSFSKVIDIFHENISIDAVVCKARIITEEKHPTAGRIKYIQPLSHDRLWDLLVDVPAFNAWFFRREVFEKIGGFDTTLKFAADRDFLIRFYLEGFKYKRYDKVVYCYRSHSGSMTIDLEKRNDFKIREEHLRIAEKYLKLNTLSNAHRRHFRKWHTYNSVELVRQFFKTGEVDLAMQIVKRGIAKNILWPFAFIRRNLHVLIDSISGKK